ncbi:MAG: helix-turn-helix transcriptional regulator [Eggerthellaceae bacterium]|jgi:DNA-binding CsgD family transcriptional regulator|nr:helix-turn-helix transcriptional regulator [Eggerthellaceae bacterium]MDR2715452.1 helix-turn-helix transcriptional regulator [Coriobacteriaceae bacterium]
MPKASRRINEQVDRKRVLKGLGGSIAERPLLCVALMLFWTWLNLAFQGPLFFPPVELANGFLLSTWFAPVLASAIAYFILGVWFRRTNRAIRQRWYLGLVAVFMTAGALLCFLWINVCGASLSLGAPLLLYLVGSLALGLGTALLMVEWGRIFGYLGPQQVLYHGIVAMSGSALLVVVLSLMPRYVGQFTLVLIPLPLVACLYKVFFSLPLKTLYCHGLNADLKTPYKFLATALLHGLSLGVLMGWLFLVGGQSNMSLLTASSFIVAAALLLLTAVFVKMDFNHLIYQVGFGITATGAFLIAVVGPLPTLGISFQLIGFCYVHLVMWGLCSYLIKNFGLPATWVIAWPTCCLMLGQLLGGITSSVLGQQAQAGFWIQMMATSMVFVLLMASLTLLSSRNLLTGWGMASPANLVHAGDANDAAVEQLAVEKSLTPREGEIFAMMARGRNRKIISAELVISEETTKSHINGLYRKLGIHSQQELLTLVEELAGELQSEDEGMAFGAQ